MGACESCLGGGRTKAEDEKFTAVGELELVEGLLKTVKETLLQPQPTITAKPAARSPAPLFPTSRHRRKRAGRAATATD